MHRDIIMSMARYHDVTLFLWSPHGENAAAAGLCMPPRWRWLLAARRAFALSGFLAADGHRRGTFAGDSRKVDDFALLTCFFVIFRASFGLGGGGSIISAASMKSMEYKH